MRALAFLALRCAAPPRRVLLRALTGDSENVHAAWTKADDWKLWQHRDDADVAELLGRKAGGVAARLRKLEDPASTAARRLFGEAEEEETIDMEDYLALDDDALLRQCRVDYRRDSGPGTDTAWEMSFKVTWSPRRRRRDAAPPRRRRCGRMRVHASRDGATAASRRRRSAQAARNATRSSPQCG